MALTNLLSCFKASISGPILGVMGCLFRGGVGSKDECDKKPQRMHVSHMHTCGCAHTHSQSFSGFSKKFSRVTMG